MAVGGILNFLGITIAYIELWVTFSVLISGVLIGCNLKMPLALITALVMTFALSHGYVHAAEMHSDINPWLYGLGFLSASAGLLTFGMLAGFLTSISSSNRIRGGFGLLCTITGVYLLSAT